MGAVSPQNSKNKVIFVYNPYLFYLLFFLYLSSKKRGNVDFARKPSHIRISLISVCIPVSLLHAGKSPVAIWYRSQLPKPDLSKITTILLAY